jgi:hypothetical protein
MRMPVGRSNSAQRWEGRNSDGWRRIAVAVAVAMTLAGCTHRYVVPNGDPDSKYSPPALQGRIMAVGPQQITVMADGGETVEIDTPSETKYFKLAGGLVLRPELVVGQRVRVWYESANPKPGAPRHAAAVLLASLDPGDDWPK